MSLPHFSIPLIAEKLEDELRVRRAIIVALNRKDREKPVGNLFYFYGGVGTTAAVARGLIDEGKPIGVTLGELSQRTRDLINEFKPVTFVDSGAYGEYTSGQVMSQMMFASRYDNLPTIGPHLYIVMPDKVGDRAETIKRATYNDGLMWSLAKNGANLLLPVQTYAEDVEQYIQDYLGTQNPLLLERYFNQIIPAIPAVILRGDSKEVHDIIKVLEKMGFRNIHLLGIGEKKSRPIVAKHPKICFFADSAWIRGKAMVSSGLSEYSRRRIESITQTRYVDMFISEGHLSIPLFRKVVGKFTQRMKMPGKTEKERIEFFVRNVIKSWRQSDYYTDFKIDVILRDIKNNTFVGEDDLIELFQHIGLIIFETEDIGLRNRVSGTMSQIASYSATRGEFFDFYDLFAKQIVEIGNQKMTIDEASKRYWKAVQKLNPALTKDGAKNAIRGLLYTKFEAIIFQDQMEVSDLASIDNMVEYVARVSRDLETAESTESAYFFNDPVNYRRFLMEYSGERFHRVLLTDDEFRFKK